MKTIGQTDRQASKEVKTIGQTDRQASKEVKTIGQTDRQASKEMKAIGHHVCNSLPITQVTSTICQNRQYGCIKQK
jgi:hypothetical protein